MAGCCECGDEPSGSCAMELFMTQLHGHTDCKIRLNFVRFKVLMTAIMKIDVFWEVAPCSHVEMDRHFRGDAGSKNLQNVGKFLRDYTAQHPRKYTQPLPCTSFKFIIHLSPLHSTLYGLNHRKASSTLL
jgi:hypothetical protein